MTFPSALPPPKGKVQLFQHSGKLVKTPTKRHVVFFVNVFVLFYLQRGGQAGRGGGSRGPALLRADSHRRAPARCSGCPRGQSSWTFLGLVVQPLPRTRAVRPAVAEEVVGRRPWTTSVADACGGGGQRPRRVEAVVVCGGGSPVVRPATGPLSPDGPAAVNLAAVGHRAPRRPRTPPPLSRQRWTRAAGGGRKLRLRAGGAPLDTPSGHGGGRHSFWATNGQ